MEASYVVSSKGKQTLLKEDDSLKIEASFVASSKGKQSLLKDDDNFVYNHYKKHASGKRLLE